MFEQNVLPTLLKNKSTRKSVLRIFSKNLREFSKIPNFDGEQVSVKALNAEGSQRLRCGRRDLNPGRQLGRLMS